MNKRRVCTVSILFPFFFFLFCSFGSAGPVTFNFAHFIPPIEANSKAGVWIEKDLNENSGDLVKSKYFHSMQMGNTIEIVKKVGMGVLQGGFVTGNYAPDLNPKFGIGTLAYCMDSYAKWNAFLKNPALREELFSSLEGKGLRVVDMCYFGLYGIATTKPARTLDDLKSMKMRTTQAKYPLAFWKAISINPVPLDWGDVVPALTQGVIDGTDQTMSAVILQKVTDVCKYYTRTDHMVGLFYFVVNDKWYKELDPKVREVITASIEKSFERARNEAMQFSDAAEGVLAEKGVEVIRFSNDDTDKLKAAQKTVWKEFESEIGKDWLDKIISFSSGI